VRECVSALVRECESAKVRKCESGFARALTRSCTLVALALAGCGDADETPPVQRVAAAAPATNALTHSRTDALRVCADPNNLPFSNARGEGFENRLAQLIAKEMGVPVR
jgi:hypothetical protein